MSEYTEIRRLRSEMDEMQLVLEASQKATIRAREETMAMRDGLSAIIEILDVSRGCACDTDRADRAYLQARRLLRGTA